MEALSSEEQERLALMVEIAPRLADAYRLKNEFLAVMHPADGLASGDIEEGLAGGGLHEQAELPVMAADA
mgnify:CR=1 FL=1